MDVEIPPTSKIVATPPMMATTPSATYRVLLTERQYAVRRLGHAADDQYGHAGFVFVDLVRLGNDDRSH